MVDRRSMHTEEFKICKSYEQIDISRTGDSKEKAIPIVAAMTCFDQQANKINSRLQSCDEKDY